MTLELRGLSQVSRGAWSGMAVMRYEGLKAFVKPGFRCDQQNAVLSIGLDGKFNWADSGEVSFIGVITVSVSSMPAVLGRSESHWICASASGHIDVNLQRDLATT